MRPAVTQRHAEALRAADTYIRTELARRPQHREGKDVRRHDDERTRRVGLRREVRVIQHRTGRGRVLHQRAEDRVVEGEGLMVAHDDFELERLGARADERDGLRVAGFGDEELRPLVVRRHRAMAERHRLGGGGGLIEHRGVGDVETGEVADHRLEVEERFEAALGNLGLVRRVLGIPAGVFEDVALDDRGRDAVVVAEAEVGFEDLVLAGDGLELAQRIELGQRGGDVERSREPDVGGHERVNHRVERVVAEGLEHLGGFIGARPDVAADKRVGVSESSRRGGHRLSFSQLRMVSVRSTRRR